MPKINESPSEHTKCVTNSPSTRSDCQRTESTINPGCYGKRKCPLGPHNRNRQWCCHFEGCLDRFILVELLKGTPLNAIRGKLVNDLCRGWSDYLALHRVGRVAVSNGFQFGRRKIDNLIAKSTIPSHSDPKFEAKEIRFAFQVEGRKGRKASKNVPKQTTKWTPCHHRCTRKVEAIT